MVLGEGDAALESGGGGVEFSDDDFGGSATFANDAAFAAVFGDVGAGEGDEVGVIGPAGVINFPLFEAGDFVEF